MHYEKHNQEVDDQRNGGQPRLQSQNNQNAAHKFRKGGHVEGECRAKTERVAELHIAIDDLLLFGIAMSQHGSAGYKAQD